MAGVEDSSNNYDDNSAPSTSNNAVLPRLPKYQKNALNNRLINKFDSEHMGLSRYYEDEVLPKLEESRTNLIAWLIKTHLLPTFCNCLNRYQPVVRLKEDPTETDGYKWLCTKCSNAVNLRKTSIFKDVNCDLPSCIRVMYGWAKGTDMDIMANILGVEFKDIETLYNKLAQATKKFIQVSELSHTWKVGGEAVIVLINIYPLTMSEISTNKHSHPILCLSEVRSEPQKYWLETIDHMDENDAEKMEKVKQQIVNIVTDTVRPGSTLLLPKPSLLYDTLKDVSSDFYFVLNLDAIAKRDMAGGRSFNGILRTIWKKPLFVCEEAQYYNPNNIEQFLIRHWWKKTAGPFAFEGLVQLVRGIHW